MAEKLVTKSNLDRIEVHLKGVSEVRVAARHSWACNPVDNRERERFLPNSDQIAWVQAVSFFIAPQTPNYDAGYLTRLMLKLVPEGLDPLSIIDLERQKERIKTGTLIFKDPVGTFIEHTSYTVVINDPALHKAVANVKTYGFQQNLTFDDIGKAENMRPDIEKTLYRWIWLRMYPDFESALLESNLPHTAKVWMAGKTSVDIPVHLRQEE